MVGGFSANDGTIDFYLRTRNPIRSSDTVLDLNAGRGQWYEDDDCRIRVSTRSLKNDVKCLIAADVDPVVLEHNDSHNQVVISTDDIGMEQNSMDLIVADYVLEHVQDPSDFVNQV